MQVGYRHFDCAKLYANELEIGAAIREAIREGEPLKSAWCRTSHKGSR
jgi:diketogulonate reductase-like aldo/keto reductase